MITITPTYWTGTDSQSPEGYNAWYYLRSTPPAFRATHEAEEWLEQHHLGPDEFGVSVIFEVREEAHA